MGLEHELVKFLEGMIDACETFKKNFTDAGITSKPEKKEMKAMAVQPPAPAVSANVDVGTFAGLKELLHTEKWPEAVNRNLICDPHEEKDKIERGRGIIELMVEENLKGLKLLDYGCGEGHCAVLAGEYNPATSVGYDIVENPHWGKFENNKATLTTDFGLVSSNGPYDVIILFDVIDHLKNEKPVEVLRKLRQLLTPEGKIYMRCHPFTSRHATHLYHDLNKAYVHLVFTEDELKELVPESQFAEKNIGITKPIVTYNQFIEEAGLQVVNRRDIRENPEELFKVPNIAQRIQAITKMNEYPEFQMSLQFIDYILKK